MGAAVLLLLLACVPPPSPPRPLAVSPLELCHQAYLAAGSDGPKLLTVDSLVVDSTTTPPTRCGPLRSAHSAIKSSE